MGEGGGGKNEMLSDVRGWGLASVLNVQSFFLFLLKKNWICIMTRHNPKPSINLLLTRNLPIDSDVRQ